MSNPTTIYLSNRQLLAELNRTKATYSYFLDDQYIHYDGAVDDVARITPDYLDEVRAAKSKLISPKRVNGRARTLIDVPREGLIIRVMTYDHVPEQYYPTARGVTGVEWLNLPFHPFKQYRVEADLSLTEVGRSHWAGGFDNGWFEPDCGKVTDRLAAMWMLLVERYAKRGNYRGYSYIEEMKGEALIQLLVGGLRFNEARTQNPFAYWTTLIDNRFKRYLNTEKKHQEVRDELLFAAGAPVSMTRQLDAEFGKTAPPAKKRGRPPKNKAA